MADNRLYLVHPGTKHTVLLAKKWGIEWSPAAGLEGTLGEFFRTVLDHLASDGEISTLDALELRIEDARGAPNTSSDLDDFRHPRESLCGMSRGSD